MTRPFPTVPPAPMALDGDPLIATFLRRVGPQLGATFSEEQLAGIRLAFSSRTMGRHAIDWRRSFGLFGRGFYVVFLLGREARSGSRRDRAPGPIAQMMILLGIALLVVGGLTMLGALAYLAKTQLGVDLFPSVDVINDPVVERLR